MSLQRHKNLYYKHSGKYGSQALLLLPATILVGPLLLGIVYAFALHYIPFIYIDFLLTMGLGLGIGICVNWAVIKGKVRNSMLAIASSIAAGLVGWYVAWIGSAWINLDFETILLNPSDILTYIQLLAENGAWGIRGATAAPIIAYFFWVVEAGIILYFAVAQGTNQTSNTPFCESTNAWANSTEIIAPLELPIDQELLSKQVESGDYSTLIRLKKMKTFTTCLAIELVGHTDDRNFRLLNLKTIANTIKSDGETSTSITYLLKHLKTDDSTNQLLQDYFKSLDETTPPAPDSPPPQLSPAV